VAPGGGGVGVVLNIQPVEGTEGRYASPDHCQSVRQSGTQTPLLFGSNMRKVETFMDAVTSTSPRCHGRPIDGESAESWPKVYGSGPPKSSPATKLNEQTWPEGLVEVSVALLIIWIHSQL
jgi:hypothetical protein